MDPNATLKEIAEALRAMPGKNSPLYSRYMDALTDAYNDLNRWLANGGFEPTWSDYPEASTWYSCRFANE